MSKDSVQEFLNHHGVNTNRFYGKCFKLSNGSLFMVDIISKEEGIYLIEENGNNRLKVFATKDKSEFLERGFYEFSIHLVVSEDGTFPVVDKLNIPPEQLKENPFKKIVDKRFERLDNPESNKIIASLMREIGKGLYSSKKRMIFELLQNADDTPAGEQVEFLVDAYEGYLLIMHNGIPFNREDVEAITSAAESTKKKDGKKTGYKGIGFKSVFTDSEKVIIKSGSFLFCFDRHYEGFDSFDDFYFNRPRFKRDPISIDEEKEKHRKIRLEFQGSNDLPWQLLPIWMDSIPNELKESKFTGLNNVGIAIKFGKSKVETYLESVQSIATHPEFMLFLRHVNKFQSLRLGFTIEKEGDENVIVNHTTREKKYPKQVFRKKELLDIPVSETSLADEGVHIYKHKKTNEFGEEEHYFSADRDGRNRIETIPPKLAAAKETSITFAAPIINNNLQADERYLKGDTFSSFFTYLPMNEHRIQLPMFVNADFVPSSDRESLQGDNEWNIYVMAKIGTNHALWISELAQKGAEIGEVESQYLSLLLKEPLEEVDEVSVLVKKYNQNYLDTLSSTPFILADTNEVLTKDAIILDNSYSSSILGNDCFYKISGTQKRLPHNHINPNYLKYEYLEIEQFGKEDLISKFMHVETREFLRDAVSKMHEQDYIKVLKWMNNLTRHSSLSSVWLKQLPFLRLNDGNILSLEEIYKSKDVLLNRSQLRDVREILSKLGFRFTKYELDSYPNIYEKVPADTINDKTLFEGISNSEELGGLSSSEKAKLLSFISKLRDVGEKKYAENLSLFSDQSDSNLLKPLRQLISNSETDIPFWLSHMKIDPVEEEALDSHFSAYLLTRKDLLQGIFCAPVLYQQAVQNINDENLDEFYRFLTDLAEKFEDFPAGRAEIPWVYVPSKKSFQKSDTVYLPDSLQKLDETSYQTVANVIESISDLLVPAFRSHSLIKVLSLGTKSVEFTESIHSGIQIGKENIGSFLSWISDAKENTFFTKFLIEKSGNNYLLKKDDRNQLYYTSGEDLEKYIRERDEEGFFRILPKELYSEDLVKAGLLTDEVLFTSLIDQGVSDIELVKFFESHLGDNLFHKFLKSLERIDIDTTQTYGADKSTAKIIELASSLISSNVINTDSIRSKIYVDNHQLSDTAVSDDIYFRNWNYSPALKLSEVLPNYKDKTYSYLKICEIFPDTEDWIRKSVFEQKRMMPYQIHESLSEIDQEILSPEQTLFMLMYAHDLKIHELFDEKSPFTVFYDDKKSKYEDLASSFFDLSVREMFVKEPFEKLNFPDVRPELTVLEPDYAIHSEQPPKWLKAWIDKDKCEKKVQFMKAVGFNHSDSAVIRLRKAILEHDSESFDTARVELTNKQQLVNTLLWVQEKKNSSNLKLTNEFLQPLYKKAADLNCALIDLPIPIFKMNGSADLSLKAFNKEARFYVNQQTWTDYKDSIFSFLSTNNRFAVPDFLPERFLQEMAAKETEPTLMLDEEKITNEAFEFSGAFYQEWDRKEELKILVYPGEKLPFNLIFDDEVLKTVDRENVHFISDSKVVVARSIENSVPEVLRSDLKEKGLFDLFTALKVQKDDWEKQSEKNKEGIDYSEEELKALKRLFDEDLPEDYKKNFNLAALVSGLVRLESLGYDVDEAYENLKHTHEYSQIEPVYKSGERIIVMCRSARQGLLYLTAQAWNRLDEPNIKFYVDLGTEECPIHHIKQDVLDSTDNDVEFQILRIESGSDLSNIEDILSGRFDTEKIWIIFKVKAKTKFDPIFYKSIQPDNTSKSTTPPKSEPSDIPY